MRVLHILNELRPSGAEEMLRIAAPLWQQNGCDLHILALADEPGDFTEQLAAAGWKIHATGHTRNVIDLFQAIRASIRKIKPDILHIHPEGYGPLLPTVCSLSGIPTFRTIHSGFGFTGLLRIRKVAERWLARKLGIQMIAISPSVYENEKSRFKNECNESWNWIDTEHFRPPTAEERKSARDRFAITDDTTLVVSVGNGADVKNYRLIVEAVALLNMPDLMYCQIGNPHPDCTDQNLASELGVASQIRFCGPSNNILQWLWAADIFAMPSLYEGFGLAAVEAIVAGAPCIFTDVPGLRDFKSMGMHAHWIQPDACQLARQIQSIKSRPTPHKDLIQSSKLACELFGSSKGAERYFQLWKQHSYDATY